MLATILIGTVLFLYAGYMIIKTAKNIKRSLKGDGCMGCDGSCQDCGVITQFDFK